MGGKMVAQFLPELRHGTPLKAEKEVQCASWRECDRKSRCR